MINKTLVEVPCNSHSLKGMILSDDRFDGKRPSLLVIHGWTSEMERYPERVKNIVEMGYVVFLFDLRGHGTTGGDLDEFSIKDHFDDVKSAFDYMLTLSNVDKSNISVFGSSYGGYLASLLSSEREFNQLALAVPALYPDEIFDKNKLQASDMTTEYRKVPHSPKDNRALNAVSNFKGNILIIEAAEDEQVPALVLKSYKDSSGKSDYYIVEGADHSFRNPGVNEERIKILTKWFQKFI